MEEFKIVGVALEQNSTKYSTFPGDHLIYTSESGEKYVYRCPHSIQTLLLGCHAWYKDDVLLQDIQEVSKLEIARANFAINNREINFHGKKPAKPDCAYSPKTTYYWDMELLWLHTPGIFVPHRFDIDETWHLCFVTEAGVKRTGSPLEGELVVKLQAAKNRISADLHGNEVD